MTQNEIRKIIIDFLKLNGKAKYGFTGFEASKNDFKLKIVKWERHTNIEIERNNSLIISIFTEAGWKGKTFTKFSEESAFKILKQNLKFLGLEDLLKEIAELIISLKNN